MREGWGERGLSRVFCVGEEWGEIGMRQVLLIGEGWDERGLSRVPTIMCRGGVAPGEREVM